MSKNTDKKHKGKVDFNTVKRLMSYVKDFKLPFTMVIIFIIISVLCSVISTVFLKVLIDNYIAPLLIQAVPNFSGLINALLLMAVVYIVGSLSTLIYNRIVVKVAQGILKKIRDDMFSHMQTLPIKYFDTHPHGDVMSHYTNDTDTLRQVIAQTIPQMFSCLIMVVSVFVAMLYLSFWLAIICLISGFIMIRVMKYITGNSRKYFVAQQKAIGDLNGYIEEMIHGQKVIKVFCHEEKAKEGFNEKNEDLCFNSTKANKFINILMPIMNNLGYVLYVVLAVIGATLAIYKVTNISLSGINVVTLGMIGSFLQLSRNFVMPMAQISQLMNTVIMALAGAERIFKLMDEASEVDDGYVTLVNAKIENGAIVETKENTNIYAWKHPRSNGEVEYTKLKGEVRFYDVDFGYNEERLVLKNITLYAEPGQKVAFVGSTGAGKTTITNLINRFYDIADGKIRYDGININKIKKADLRKSLGIVLQDVNLFTGTVMDNIRYGKLNATDEECIEASKLANAHNFIEMLPKGYDTILTGDGGGLSQGQRQLISIARAAVANPPVMILDEATSSIDTRTEAIVQRGMDSLMKGRTVFVIAHRLSTVKNSDVIMVLENGNIIERGSHSSLIEQKGKYYQLYTGAFELE